MNHDMIEISRFFIYINIDTTCCPVFNLHSLTHWGLGTPYGDIELGHYLPR